MDQAAKLSIRHEYEQFGVFSFQIPLIESDSKATGGNESLSNLPDSVVVSFQSNGFVVFPNVISRTAANLLNDRLEDVLQGTYDRGRKPDKFPRILKGEKPLKYQTEGVKDGTTGSPSPSSPGNDKRQSRHHRLGPIGFNGNFLNVKVLQIINIHKADSLFRRLETNRTLGQIVAQLAGWDAGARLAQDQVWAKPPGAPPLVFHRDSPYFMFEPTDVVTVWLALDDMDEEVGPLEYVRGSHKWGDGRVGSAKRFFQSNVKSLLKSAAEREGLDLDDLDIISMAGLNAGGMSIHHGKIWHGSGKNCSRNRPRRGLGMHFVPANVKFTKEAVNSSLWRPFVSNVDDPSTVALSEEDFPLSIYPHSF